MNGINIIADTNILIKLLNQEKEIFPLIDQKVIYISFITELELYCSKSLNSTEKKIIDSLIDNCIIIDINSDIKKLAIDFRIKYLLKLPDSIIAATAAYLQFPFITSDKDFKAISEVDIIIYNK